MSAVEGKLRFYVDESALALGKTLAVARQDVVHCGHALMPECPLGTKDSDWMPAVAARGLIVLGRDKHIRTRPGEREVLREAGLRVIRIGGKQDLPTWDWLVRVVRHWERIEELVISRPDGPWFYLLNAHGLAEVDLSV